MIGALILFLVPGLVAFLVALLLRRWQRAIAWIAGGVPAALLLAANLDDLGNPLVWLYLAVFAVPSLFGAHAGVELARRLVAWRQGRREGGAAEQG